MMNYAEKLRELADNLEKDFDRVHHQVGFKLIDIGFQLHFPLGITDLRDILNGVLKMRKGSQ